MEAGSTGDDLEQIPDDFVCCICLDAIYKPVVLACGHMSCFWCVHRSMSGVQMSPCPICRHLYWYFPSICELFHTLLVKIYPETYRRRCSQILGVEKKNGRYSPVICSSHQGDDDGNLLNMTSDSTAGDINTADLEGSSLSETNHKGASQSISLKDVLCSACNQLLYQPVVLNCGHVVCLNCVTPTVNESIQAVCQVCQRPDPRGHPKVCLAFDNFLVEHFPKEYAMRKEGTIVSDELQEDIHEEHCYRYTRCVHEGVGCDFCGMYPIIGERYRCMDCIHEHIGFDLCRYCHDSPLEIPGRFNQQHTSEHKFELLRMPSSRDGFPPVIMRLRYRNPNPPAASQTADQDVQTNNASNTQ